MMIALRRICSTANGLRSQLWLAIGLLALVAPPTAGQSLPGGNPNAPEQVRFYHSDALGSVRVVTDIQGQVVSRADYLPFGEQIPQAKGRGDIPEYGEDAGNKQKFTGKLRDSENGLDYFGARYFSGAQGRFSSPDPANTGAVVGDAQSWNGYAYARNSPLKYVDPDGLAFRICDSDGNCMEGYSDERFRKYFLSDKGITFKGNQVYKEGKLIGSAERTSFDDLSPLAQGVFNQLSAWREPMKQTIGFLAAGSAVAGTGLGAAEAAGLLGTAGTTSLGLQTASAASLGAAIGGQLQGLATGKMNAIASGVSSLGLSRAHAVIATQAAIRELGLRSVVVQMGNTTVVASVAIGPSKQVLVVAANGIVTRATADLSMNGAQMVVSNLR